MREVAASVLTQCPADCGPRLKGNDSATAQHSFTTSPVADHGGTELRTAITSIARRRLTPDTAQTRQWLVIDALTGHVSITRQAFTCAVINTTMTVRRE